MRAEFPAKSPTVGLNWASAILTVSSISGAAAVFKCGFVRGQALKLSRGARGLAPGAPAVMFSIFCLHGGRTAKDRLRVRPLQERRGNWNLGGGCIIAQRGRLCPPKTKS